MNKIYDFDSGCLKVSYRDIASFDLVIRKPKIQILDSGIFSNILVRLIRCEKKNSRFNVGCADDVSNIFAFDDLITERDLSEIKDSLIVINRCDLVLSPENVDFIVADRSNDYLLFGRKAFPLGLSPNYYGEFVRDSDNNLTISYKYSEKGWF